MSSKNGSLKNILADPSLWLLLFSNVITIFLAVKEGWSFSMIIWVYWFQSITIGFFNFIQIRKIEKSSVKSAKSKRQGFSVGFFFLAHYGFFHFVYLIFLLAKSSKSEIFLEVKYILLAFLIFFLSHLFSYLYNKSEDTKKQRIDYLMFHPYVRIIPMHFILGFGFALNGTLILFLILKTAADLIMHAIEHAHRF